MRERILNATRTFVMRLLLSGSRNKRKFKPAEVSPWHVLLVQRDNGRGDPRCDQNGDRHKGGDGNKSADKYVLGLAGILTSSANIVYLAPIMRMIIPMM